MTDTESMAPCKKCTCKGYFFAAGNNCQCGHSWSEHDWSERGER